MRRIFVCIAASALLCVGARAQDDAPSLGDVARQARAQKQKDNQVKNSPAKDASTADAKVASSDAQGAASSVKDASQAKSHVITDEELPAHIAAVKTAKHDADSSAPDSKPTGDRDAQAEQWKSQIQAQKSAIAELQREITELGDSIHYVGGNCVENCAQWNERQQQKQQQVDSMKAQLEDQQHRLEDMQDTARKQGFGSSVYDP